MKLLMINQAGERVPAGWLGRWLKSLSAELARHHHRGLSRKELVVVFVSKREIRHLNRQYREKDYATDILSFESADPSALGELVLSLDVIRAQSRRTGLSPRAELAYMIVHGVLHLLGYDHETSESDASKMFALQDALFALLSERVGFR